jgi:hypothetical protein
MIKTIASLALAGLVAAAAVAPRPADASVHLDVHVGLPVAPPLVVVQPGVQVVEDFDEEVFFVRNRYWVRRGGHWYRAPGPRARFVHVEPRYVPATLVKIPPGQYVKYKKVRHEKPHKHSKHGRGHDDQGHRGDRDHDRHDDHGRGNGKHKH